MGTIVGRNLKLEVALTYRADSPDFIPSGITKDYPPVVTKSGHGAITGDIGFWTMPGGMVELDEQAAYVRRLTDNTFEMPGLESTDFSTYTTGLFTVGETWGVISEASQLTVGGGAAAEIDDGRLLDIKDRTISGNLAAQNVTVSIRPQEQAGEAMQFVKRQAKKTAKLLFKASKNGVVLLCWYGAPSLPGLSVANGAGATGDFSIQVPQFVVEPNIS
jgi:hypothetical protein